MSHLISRGDLRPMDMLSKCNDRMKLQEQDVVKIDINYTN